ncbi:MAG: hypothetical protein NVSMB56_14050 [Pyrinomonadaceae bacterium]
MRNKFINSNPYRIERESDPQTGYNVYRVFDIQTPPVEIGLLAGDVIHNLRSVLDHLAYQLVYVNGATIPSKPLSLSGIARRNTKPNELEE